MEIGFTTQVFIPPHLFLDTLVRQEIKTRLIDSYHNMTTHEEVVKINKAIIIFRHGRISDIQSLLPIYGDYRVESYTTIFEGLNVHHLFNDLWTFNPAPCEITLIGAIQYRIRRYDPEEYQIDIGKMCGEQSVRLIRISDYIYTSKKITIL